MAEAVEEKVEQHVVPTRREPQTGRVAVPDELREPGVVHVATKVAGGNVAMPENGCEDSGGNRQHPP